MILPHGYKVGFGINLTGLSGQNCADFQRNFAIYNRLSKKKDKSKATRQRAKALADEYLAKYYACVKGNVPTPVVTPPVTPAPVTPAPVTPTPVTPTPETVVGTPTTAYAPPATSSGGPLPVPGPVAYPDSVPAPAPVAGPVAECDLAGLGKLPLTYSDLYGPMRVLGVYGCQAATPQAAASTSQQAVDQQIQSSDLWSG
jgi:hypothetical protein